MEQLPVTHAQQAVGLIMTYRCNLACTYCYIAQKKPRDMALGTAQGILEPLLKSGGGMLEIMLMGAETLMAYAVTRPLVEWAEALGANRPFHFFGSTNGTLLTQESKNWFFAHRKSITLGLSYDGLPATQDSNRSGSAGDIDLDYFLRTWPHQRVQMTVDAHSVGSMAQGAIALLAKGFAVNANAAYEREPWPRKAVAEYARQLKTLTAYYAAHPKAPRLYQFTHPLLAYAQNLRSTEPQSRQCGAGDGFGVFDVDGARYPCHMLSPLVLTQQQVEDCPFDALASETMDFEDPRCAGCAYRSDCSTCAGCNYRFRGSFTARDVTHCQLTQLEVMATMKLQTRLLLQKQSLTAEDLATVRAIETLTAWQAGKA